MLILVFLYRYVSLPGFCAGRTVTSTSYPAPSVRPQSAQPSVHLRGFFQSYDVLLALTISSKYNYVYIN